MSYPAQYKVPIYEGKKLHPTANVNHLFILLLMITMSTFEQSRNGSRSYSLVQLEKTPLTVFPHIDDRQLFSILNTYLSLALLAIVLIATITKFVTVTT